MWREKSIERCTAEQASWGSYKVTVIERGNAPAAVQVAVTSAVQTLLAGVSTLLLSDARFTLELT